MLNKNEYLLNEILKAVDGAAKDKSDDAILSAIDGLEKSQIEIGGMLHELQDSIADLTIELTVIKLTLQEIIDIVSKQTVDIVQNVDNSKINRTRKILSAYGGDID